MVPKSPIEGPKLSLDWALSAATVALHVCVAHRAIPKLAIAGPKFTARPHNSDSTIVARWCLQALSRISGLYLH